LRLARLRSRRRWRGRRTAGRGRRTTGWRSISWSCRRGT